MTDAVMRRVRLTPTVVAVVALGLLSLGATQLEPTAGARDGSYHGYFALRLAAGEPVEVVDELHADRVFVPASVLKVLTVAAALEHLGAAYRWRTWLSPRGTVAGSILDGDLVVEAGADPTWSSTPTDGDHLDPFMALADQLRASGLTLITGDLIIDTTRFPGRPHPVDRGYDDLPYRHGTPPAALSLDEATVSVRVAPGPIVGAPALILAPDGIDIINHTTTVGRDRHGAGTLDFLPLWGTDTLLLRGEYPISEAPFVMAASDPTPELRVAQRLRSTLAETGVRVEGTVQLQSQGSVPSASGPPLAEFRSAPLGDLLQETLTESHNWYADMLTLTLALEVAGSGRFDDGVEVISDFVRGLVPDHPQGTIALSIQDGSGLSPSNLVTPTTVVRVLAYALEQPWGRALLQAMAGPGEGTLAAWPALPPIAAKTGTLRHTVALAGILDPASDAPVIFCYFVNHQTAQPLAERRRIAARVGEWRSATSPR